MVSAELILLQQKMECKIVKEMTYAKRLLFILPFVLFLCHGASAVYLPVTGDWNGDSKTEIGVYQPINYHFSAGQTCQNGTCINETSLVPFSFDPGMKLRRIASPNPSEWNYFESCPDGPGDMCAGELPPGSGFYTLGAGCFGVSAPVQCLMNSGTTFYPLANDHTWTGTCPFYYYWKQDGDSPVAYMKIDPRSFEKNWATDFYIGVQKNIYYGSLYGGLDFNNPDHAPLLKDIDTIALKVRAKLCYTKFPVEHPRAGSVFTYISFVNPRKNNDGGQFAIDLFVHKNNVTYYNYSWFSDSIKTELVLCGDACKNSSKEVNEGRNKTIILSGKYLGIVPQSYDFFIDNTSDCSTPIENAPWLSVEIPLQTVIQRTLEAGYFSDDMLDGAKYSGGIVAGTEFWGRALVELEVKNYTMYHLEVGTSTTTTTSSSTTTTTTSTSTTTTLLNCSSTQDTELTAGNNSVDFQTPHNYPKNMDCYSGVYLCPAGYYSRVYAKYDSETNYDFFYIFDSITQNSTAFTGNSSGFRWLNPQNVSSGIFRFSSDDSYNRWGVDVDTIECYWSNMNTTSTTTSSSTTSTSTTSTTSTTESTTSTSTTTSSTTTTTEGSCLMPGNNLPCGDVTLSEVVFYINQWAAGTAGLGDVIDLINSWADPAGHPPV